MFVLQKDNISLWDQRRGKFANNPLWKTVFPMFRAANLGCKPSICSIVPGPPLCHLHATQRNQCKREAHADNVTRSNEVLCVWLGSLLFLSASIKLWQAGKSLRPFTVFDTDSHNRVMPNPLPWCLHSLLNALGQKSWHNSSYALCILHYCTQLFIHSASIW